MYCVESQVYYACGRRQFIPIVEARGPLAALG
jgi:hypothetical protein